jgi:ribosome biogenesis protein Tsr3
VQVFGSVLILIPFALAQTGRMNAKSLGYLVLNLAGSGILAADAALTSQWGFLLLEGSWAAVSLFALVSGAVKRGSPAEPS